MGGIEKLDWIEFSKFVVLLVLLILGLIFIINGYQSREPPSERTRRYSDWKLTSDTPHIHSIYFRMNMTPTEAFVVENNITTNVEFDVLATREQWERIGNVSAAFALPEAIYPAVKGFLNQSCWIVIENPIGNYTEHEGIVRVFNNTTTVHYPYEGTFGLNVTLVKHNKRILNATFNKVLSIESIRYLEERRMTYITYAFGQIVLGLAIIAIGSVLTHFIDHLKKVIDSLKKVLKPYPKD